MKKVMYVAIVAMFLFAGMVSVASAAVTNGEIKGSLFVLPKIVVTDTTDTIITIGNDAGSASIYLHCQWMDQYQNTKDVHFPVTPHGMNWFRASDGTGSINISDYLDGPYGSLTCWASDEATDAPLSRNQLFAQATIYDYANLLAVSYNGYAFRALAGLNADDQLLLDNSEYDACPQYALGTFMFTGAKFEDLGYTVEAVTTDLTLYACKQDLKQAPTPTITKARFTIYDENENGTTNTTLCFKCWVETTLDEVPVQSGNAGTFKNFKRWMAILNGDEYVATFGYFRVNGVAGTEAECGLAGPAVASPVIGTLFRTVDITSPGDLVMTGGILQSTTTADTSGFISFDKNPGSVEASQR